MIWPPGGRIPPARFGHPGANTERPPHIVGRAFGVVVALRCCHLPPWNRIACAFLAHIVPQALALPPKRAVPDVRCCPSCGRSAASHDAVTRYRREPRVGGMWP
jgi:hypothetical protein